MGNGLELGLEQVLNDAYDSEINVGLSCFWDSGWTARIGDVMNGFKGELLSAETTTDLAIVIAEDICVLFPDSFFAKKYKNILASSERMEQ